MTSQSTNLPSQEYDAIIDFANAIEAAAVKLKHNLGVDCTNNTTRKQKEQQKERVWNWDPTKINWQNKDGPKGPFQLSEDVGNTQYSNLLADMIDHKGRLNREGFFYWVFGNNVAVGRKKL